MIHHVRPRNEGGHRTVPPRPSERAWISDVVRARQHQRDCVAKLALRHRKRQQLLRGRRVVRGESLARFLNRASARATCLKQGAQRLEALCEARALPPRLLHQPVVLKPRQLLLRKVQRRPAPPGPLVASVQPQRQSRTQVARAGAHWSWWEHVQVGTPPRCQSCVMSGRNKADRSCQLRVLHRGQRRGALQHVEQA